MAVIRALVAAQKISGIEEIFSHPLGKIVRYSLNYLTMRQKTMNHLS